MKGTRSALFLFAAIASAGPAMAQGQSQYPIVDKIADQLITKYQSSSCAQLAAQKEQPPSGQKAEMMQKAVQQLKQDPQMREYFINKVAAPIANKMFDCGMIP
jgi:hypothetical protein